MSLACNLDNRKPFSAKQFLSKQDCYDVIIVGAGPAGLMASLCLRTFCFNVLHIDNQAQPTPCGKADGIQARTVEVLRNFGRSPKPRRSTFIDQRQSSKIGEENYSSTYSTSHIDLATHLLSQGNKAHEIAFWDPVETTLLERTLKSKVCPGFIDVRDRYTLLLHQGLIEREFLREIYNRSTSHECPAVLRPAKFIKAENLFSSAHDSSPEGYAIGTKISIAGSGYDSQTPNAQSLSHHSEEVWLKSNYVLGCDGARSDVRKSLDGKIILEGLSSNIFWAVMDCWVESNYPDLRLKCAVHSKTNGSLMVIPRENDLVRFYVQLKVEERSKKEDWNLEFCQAHAQKIFQPFELNFSGAEWFSVYQIGQRLANKYTLDGRVILGGDAVHTHSPKAGQGMNISMLDMHCLSWKINLVEKGIGKRNEIMETYESERRGIAEDLIKFDAEYAALFSGASSSSSKDFHADKPIIKLVGEVDANRFIETFKKNINFTTGCGAIYPTNVFNALPNSDLYKKHRYTKIQGPLRPGERLLPGDATRFIDGEMVQIEQEIKMDGSFRIYIFAGKSPAEKICLRLNHLSSNLGQRKEGRSCFLDRFKSPNGQPCSIFDSEKPQGCNPFFSLSLISSREQPDWELKDLPEIFSQKFRSYVYIDDQVNYDYGRDLGMLNLDAPRKTHSHLTPLSLHAKYGIDEDEDEGGGIIVVRPDGYVGLIADLDHEGWETIEDYFSQFLCDHSV